MVPHQMILLSLQVYHILNKISKMLRTYFDGFHMQFATKDYTNWIKNEVELAVGCSVSLILFILAMQLFFKVTENNADIVELCEGGQIPPVKAFMDDTKILSFKEFTNRKILMLYCHIHVHAEIYIHIYTGYIPTQ